jgi:hypothetical protein
VAAGGGSAAGAVRVQAGANALAGGDVDVRSGRGQTSGQVLVSASDPSTTLANAPAPHGERARAVRTLVDGLLKQAALHRRRMAFCNGLKKGDQVFLPRWRRLCVVHKVDKVRGLNVTITTSAETDEEARVLLTALGMPFRAEGYSAEERAARRRKKMRKYRGRKR